MKVILKSEVKSIGKAGELHEVDEGYGRNFLLPRGLAVEANAKNMNEYKNREAANAFKKEQEAQGARQAFEMLNGKTIRLTAKAGSAGRLFGAVTAAEVASALSEQTGITVDKRKIQMDKDIKAFGSYAAEIKLYPGLTASVTVMVSE